VSNILLTSSYLQTPQFRADAAIHPLVLSGRPRNLTSGHTAAKMLIFSVPPIKFLELAMSVSLMHNTPVTTKDIQLWSLRQRKITGCIHCENPVRPPAYYKAHSAGRDVSPTPLDLSG